MIITVIGLSLLVLLVVDIFLTAFHAEGRSGPVNQVQNRFIWSLIRGIGGLRGIEGRRRVHALTGPILSIMTIITWVLLLIFSYACLYYPLIENFVFAHADMGHPVVETIYYSGYVTATLGLGDVIATGSAMRIITVIQSLSGFALFGVAVTYVLGVQQEVRRMKVLAAVIHNYFATGVDHVLNQPRTMDAGSLATWCADTSVALLEVMEAQMQYPLLHKFRPVETSRSLVLQAGCLIEFLDEVDSKREGGELATLRAHPAFQQLHTAVERYLAQLNKYFVPSRVPFLAEHEDLSRLEAQHQRLLIYLDFRT